EPEADGLLELVGERPGEEDDGDVRLPDVDGLDRVRVGGRVGELLDEAAGVGHGAWGSGRVSFRRAAWVVRYREARRGAGVVDRDGLENRCTGNRTEGSNPSLSA